MVLKNIFSSFFEKDLKILSDIREIRELRNLILLPRFSKSIDKNVAGGRKMFFRYRIA